MAKKLSIRQQLETAVLEWLTSSFSGTTEFTSVTFSKGQQSAEITMPICTAVCDDATEEEFPGLGVFKVGVSIVLMTTIDAAADPDGAHLARADVVANRLNDLDAVRSHINSTGRVHVFGFGTSKSSHSVVDRHFVDRFEIDAHCRSA